MAKRQRSIRVGSVEVRKLGARRFELRDPYHLILTLTWAQFFALVVAYFLIANLVFATAYWLVGGSVAHARPGVFADHFFFSVETLATVGYGEMSPATLYGHVVAAVEIFFGMMSLALVTGLIFARFSKPTARILFSDKVVIRDFEGERVLMLRMANERHNRIVEANAALSMVRREAAADGENLFRIHDLPLARSRSPAFALSWTLIHRIDAASPLYGWSRERLIEQGTRILISVTGHDETIAAPVYALHEYAAEQILPDHRFVDVILEGEDGERIVDLTRFHDVESDR